MIQRNIINDAIVTITILLRSLLRSDLANPPIRRCGTAHISVDALPSLDAARPTRKLALLSLVLGSLHNEGVIVDVDV
jgi:hypothetical protein